MPHVHIGNVMKLMLTWCLSWRWKKGLSRYKFEITAISAKATFRYIHRYGNDFNNVDDISNRPKKVCIHNNNPTQNDGTHHRLWDLMDDLMHQSVIVFLQLRRQINGMKRDAKKRQLKGLTRSTKDFVFVFEIWEETTKGHFVSELSISIYHHYLESRYIHSLHLPSKMCRWATARSSTTKISIHFLQANEKHESVRSSEQRRESLHWSLSCVIRSIGPSAFYRWIIIIIITSYYQMTIFLSATRGRSVVCIHFHYMRLRSFVPNIDFPSRFFSSSSHY